MAKTQKYSEDLLLEAVVRFSEIEKKKIKATELAKWCRKNIEELDEVRDYHFTRTIKERDLKSGKMIERSKLCTLKIDEINKLRDISSSISTNLLLRASNIESFMELPDTSKRKMIIETRETVDKLVVHNSKLQRENEALKIENESMKSKIEYAEENISQLQKSLDKLNKQVTYVMKVVDENARKQILINMGINDETIDLDRYIQSLCLEANEIMNINASLKKQVLANKDIAAKELEENILSGLEF